MTARPPATDPAADGDREQSRLLVRQSADSRFLWALLCPPPTQEAGSLNPLLSRAQLTDLVTSPARRVEETTPMPHNMFFGVSNYVSLAVIVVVVVVVLAAVWWRNRAQ